MHDQGSDNDQGQERERCADPSAAEWERNGEQQDDGDCCGLPSRSDISTASSLNPHRMYRATRPEAEGMRVISSGSMKQD